MDLLSAELLIITLAAVIYIGKSATEMQNLFQQRAQERQAIALNRQLEERHEQVKEDFEFWWGVSGGNQKANSFIEQHTGVFPDFVCDQIRNQIKTNLLHYVTDRKSADLFEEMFILKAKSDRSPSAEAEVERARKERTEHLHAHEMEMLQYGYEPSELAETFELPAP